MACPRVPASRCTPNRHGAHHRPTRAAHHDAVVCTEATRSSSSSVAVNSPLGSPARTGAVERGGGVAIDDRPVELVARRTARGRATMRRRADHPKHDRGARETCPAQKDPVAREAASRADPACLPFRGHRHDRADRGQSGQVGRRGGRPAPITSHTTGGHDRIRARRRSPRSGRSRVLMFMWPAPSITRGPSCGIASSNWARDAERRANPQVPPGRRDALLRPAPLRAVRATRRGIRLKQAPGAIQAVRPASP